eukprot:12243-Heterococcus_DN1.PRE.2
MRQEEAIAMDAECNSCFEHQCTLHSVDRHGSWLKVCEALQGITHDTVAIEATAAALMLRHAAYGVLSVKLSGHTTMHLVVVKCCNIASCAAHQHDSACHAIDNNNTHDAHTLLMLA